MYLEHFGLRQPPFRITPNQDFFYSGANRGAILDALAYAITSGEGVVKIVGEVGTGKTMLCRALESRLPDNIDIIYLPNPSLPRHEVLHAIADELGLLQTADQKSTQIIRRLQNHLIDKHAQGRQVAMFIDEAQAMPPDSLEEIRLLSNLETASSKLLQIVLFGQPELDRHIDQPQIRQIKERITHSFYLRPFNKKEVADYLAYRMRAAGYRGPQVFSQGAVRLISQASLGLVRRVNILADKSLLAAFSDNTHAVTVKQVNAAIRDSSYAPLPALPFARLAPALLLAAGVAAAVWWAALEWPPAALPPSKPQPAVAAPPAPTPAEIPAAPNAEPAPRLEPPEEAQAPAQPEPEPVSAEPAPQPSSLQSRLEASREWLKNQNGGHFAIHLMAVSPEAAETELERIHVQTRLTPEQLIVYHNTVNNKAVITIATGAFPSIREAKAALAKLPVPYSQYNPLLRTIKSIRDGIEKKQ